MQTKKTIKFQIVTPERIVTEEEIYQITLPTSSGEITVLPSHIPLVSSLIPGVIELKNKEKNSKILSISGGFVEILKDKIIILADTAERAENLDLNVIKEAKENAKKALEKARNENKQDFFNLKAKLAKELARDKAIQKWKKLNK